MDGSAQSRHFDGVSSRRRLVLPVGQEDDQAELLEDLSAAIDGDGRVVVIGGEAGIGKTTLVRSLAGDAGERNVRVLETSCFELYSTPAFGPWLDLFANLDQDPALPAAPAAICWRIDAASHRSGSPVCVGSRLFHRANESKSGSSGSGRSALVGSGESRSAAGSEPPCAPDAHDDGDHVSDR